MIREISKDYENKLKEFVFTDTSVEIETLFNNGAKLNASAKELLQRYTQIEFLYHNLNSCANKEQANKIRAEYKKLKAELEKIGLKDLNKDDIITTLSKYIKSNLYSQKAFRYMQELGLVDNCSVTEMGKWFAHQMVKYPSFKCISVDDNNLSLIRDTIISLYNNKIEITNNNVFNSELNNIKTVYNTRKEIKNKVATYDPKKDNNSKRFAYIIKK